MINFVTSFRVDASYAPGFLESWQEHNSHLNLYVYYDGGRWKNLPETGENTISLDLEGQTRFMSFKSRWKKNKDAAGGYWRDYRWDGLRFAPKVFAYTDVQLPDTGWRVWVDADAVFTKPMDEQFFRRALPETAIMSWLERPEWGYCEAGWLGFRVDHPAIKFLLRYMQRIYDEDILWSYAQWHDAYLLQRAVDEKIPGWKWMIQSLADVSMEQLHPWPQTILGDYITHNKGNLKNDAGEAKDP